MKQTKEKTNLMTKAEKIESMLCVLNDPDSTSEDCVFATRILAHLGYKGPTILKKDKI